MCGIVGLAYRQAHDFRQEAERRVQTMIDVQAHRGADAEGLVDEHRRDGRDAGPEAARDSRSLVGRRTADAPDALAPTERSSRSLPADAGPLPS